MRRPRTAAGLLFAVALCTGCLFRDSPHREAGWFDRARGHAPADGGVVLRTVILDRPAGDAYLSSGMWSSAAKPLTHEQTTLLARNGLRVGVFTGMVPGEFERLVHSDAATLNPTHRTTQPGKAKVVPVNGPLDAVAYKVLHDLAADPATVEAAGAECGLSVTPFPTRGGLIRLECSFQVQHGEKQAYLKPTSDGTTFTRQDRKPLEQYPTLAFEVTLGPHDYLVVGPSDDPAGTLGQAFFTAGAEDRVRQRALVIRAVK